MSTNDDDDDGQPMAVVRSVRNNNVVHHYLPAGFKSCLHDHALCPACNSTLTLKIPTKPSSSSIKKKNKRGATAAALEANVDLQTTIQKNLQSSLESAHAANLLLQALSFDAATREEMQELQPAQLTEGVSYCPDCKVHVVTSAEELERLFEEYDDSDNEDGSNMEWLRGSLLVAVDDDEVVALKPGRHNQHQHQAPPQPQRSELSSTNSNSNRPQSALSQPVVSLLTQPSDLRAQPSYSLPIIAPSRSPQQSQQHAQFSQPQMSLLSQPSEMSMRSAIAQHQQFHDVPKPTTPIEFTYDYRHKVATHAMAHRISRGYTLLEEICPECEMPLMKMMKGARRKECVVCPKLIKKIAKYNQQRNAHAQNEENFAQFQSQNNVIEKRDELPQSQSTDATNVRAKQEMARARDASSKRRYYDNDAHHFQSQDDDNVPPEQKQESMPHQDDDLDHVDVDPNDPISAIIAEARSEAPRHNHQSNHSSRRAMVRPDVAEAKQYVMQRRIPVGGSINGPVTRTKHDGPAEKEVGGKKGLLCGGNSSEAGSAGTDPMTDHSVDTNNNEQVQVANTNKNKNNSPIDWEELLINGRSILSKRLNEGWNLSSTNNCSGINCNGTPLITQQCEDNGVDVEHCVVCGGVGNGKDGAYGRELEYAIEAAKLAEREANEANPNWEELAGNGRALLAERLKQGWTMSSDNCLGYHCNSTPLTNLSGGPNSCVVCGGSGSGCDGGYENYKPDQVVEEERALVSEELSRLLSMGWVLRESLCVGCLMPMVAEDVEAEDNLCVLCGHLPENNPHLDNGCDSNDDGGNADIIGDIDSIDDGGDPYAEDSYVHEYAANEAYAVENGGGYVDDEEEVVINPHLNNNYNANDGDAGGTVGEDLYSNDSYVNEYLANDAYAAENHGGYINDEQEVIYEESETQTYLEDGIEEVLVEYSEAVYDPVATYGDDNTDEAGRKLIAGWILPDAGLCHHCHGVQMTPPNSTEVGCINRGCPSALAAAYTFLPDPTESTGPLRLIGRGFSNPKRDHEEEEDVRERNVEVTHTVEQSEGQFLNQVQEEALHYHHEKQYEEQYREQYEEQQEHYGRQYEEQREEQYEEQYEAKQQYLYENTHHDLPTEVSGGHDEPSVLSDDLSQGRSIASSALGIILVQLDDAKYELDAMQKEGSDPQECAEKQVEIAMLIEKLASAVVRMKQKE